MADKTNKEGKGIYKIGQVVYILSNKGQSIIPAMIVEQATVQTLSAKRVSWKLAMGTKNNPNKPQTVVDSAEINGEIYPSLEAVRYVLQTRLVKFIDDITIQAKKRTELWYGEQLQKANKKSEEKKLPLIDGKIDPEDLLKDLDNAYTSVIDEELDEQSDELGQMPADEQQQLVSPLANRTGLSEEAQKQELQDRLKRLAKPTDEELGEEKATSDPTSPMGYIQGPNGTKIPVIDNIK